MVDEHVGEILSDNDAVIADGYSHMLRDNEAAFPELVRQRILIDFLEEPGTEGVLHGEGAADHALGQVVQRVSIRVHRRASALMGVKTFFQPVRISVGGVPRRTLVLLSCVGPAVAEPGRSWGKVYADEE